jgi:hypothetical protein
MPKANRRDVVGGDGGYVVSAGSVHVSGATSRFAEAMFDKSR